MQKKEKKTKHQKPWHVNIDYTICPECETETITYDHQHNLEYCIHCGLITRQSIPYTAGKKLNLPYHLLL